MNYPFKASKSNKGHRNGGKADFPHRNHGHQPTTGRKATKAYILSAPIAAQRTATSRMQTSLESTKRQAAVSIAQATWL